jgi:tetratricopeptide (TPR) repeat protein
MLLLLWSSYPTAAQDSSRADYYTPENIYRFARHLYDEGDYRLAAGEFLRYLHYSDQNLKPPDSTLYLIGLCYRQSENYFQANEYFRRIISSPDLSDYRDSARYQTGYGLFLAEHYQESSSELTASLPEISSGEIKSRIRRLLGLNYLYQQKWLSARLVYDSLIEDNTNDTISALFRNYAVKGIELPRKSAFKAGFMSAAIPGSGKIYARRLTDGVFSFLVIGLTTWQAYDGFSDDGTNSAKGWIYGTLSGILYTGNIYGSVVAVKLHNRRLEDGLLRSMEGKVSLYFD